jgi:hypothetical protein
MVDCIVAAFRSLDYNTEMAFDAVKIATLYRAFYEDLGRKFMAWTDETVERSWAEIASEHDDVCNCLFGWVQFHSPYVRCGLTLEIYWCSLRT